MKLAFITYSHPRRHDHFMGLARQFALLGHSCTYHAISNGRSAEIERDLGDLTNFTFGWLPNPLGSDADDMIDDILLEWPETLWNAVDQQGERLVADPVGAVLDGSKPEAIFTEGLLALAGIGHLNEHCRIPGVDVGWAHLTAHDYKYGIDAPDRQRTLGLKFLRRYIKQTDLKLASTRGSAHRLEKDYRLRDRVIILPDAGLKDALQDVLRRLASEVSSPRPGALRVWHGPVGTAGQPAALSAALNRRGTFSRCHTLGRNYFEYPVDRHYPEMTVSTTTKVMVEVSKRYNVAHMHFRSLYFNKISLSFSTALDILLLRAAGVAVVMNYWGSEVRLQDDFRRMNPFHYADEAVPAVKNFPDWSQRLLLDFVRATASGITVPDPELQSFVPDAELIPRALDLADFGFVGVEDTASPLVVHAPTKRDIKGTSHVLAAVESLRRAGLRFRFELVENLSHAAALERYRAADIIVDQLRIGWYGVLAVEGMALGKPVISYIRPDLIDSFGSEGPPLMIADPLTIEHRLGELVESVRLRKAWSRRGYEYVRQTHDADKVAELYESYYLRVLRNPRPVDPAAAIRFIERQAVLHEREVDELLERINRLQAMP